MTMSEMGKSVSMISSSAILYGLIVLEVATVSGITQSERSAMVEKAMPVLLFCTLKNFRYAWQLTQAVKAKDPDAVDPCFYECLFTKWKIINKNGFFDYDAYLAIHKEFIQGKDDLENISGIGKSCSTVNEKTIHNSKSCDRSKSLMRCLVKHESLEEWNLSWNMTTTQIINVFDIGRK